MSDLFGGSKSTSTPVDMTPKPFQGIQSVLASSLAKQVNEGVPGYEGPLNAPIGANEQNLLDQLMTQTGAGTQRAGLISDTLGGKFLPGQAGANPFLQAAIQAAQRPTFQGLEETLSRTLPGKFTQAGQFVHPGAGQTGTSAFDRAAAIAARAASDTAGDIATKLSFGVHEAERGRQQEAVGLSRQEVDATVTNLQAQALPRMIQELGIERGMAEFQRRTTALLDVLKVMAGVTQPTIANQQTSTTKPNIIGTLLGSGGVSGMFGSTGAFGSSGAFASGSAPAGGAGAGAGAAAVAL